MADLDDLSAKFEQKDVMLNQIKDDALPNYLDNFTEFEQKDVMLNQIKR